MRRLALLLMLLAGPAWAGAFDSVPPASPANVFDIRRYGAICNGTVNDDAAINAAATAAFNSTAYQNNNAVSIVGPSGATASACVMNSINLTQFNKGTGSNTRPRVLFGDMTLLCTGAGKNCIDVLGADLVKLHDLSIRGDTVAPPEICIQTGAVTATSAAWHQLERVTCNSEFTFTARYDMGSEANEDKGSMFVNNHSSSGPIFTTGTVVAGTGGTSNFYTNVALTGGTGTGATANITVTGGGVTTFAIAYQGRNYVAGDTMSAASGDIGGTTGFSVPVTATKSYAAVYDGQNHWRASSAFVTETLPVDTWQSLTLVTIQDTNIRQTASGGGGIWLGWTGGLHMIHSYVVSSGASCMEIYDSGVTKSGIPGPNWGLDLDFNCEGSALSQAILFTGSHATQTLQSFRFKGYHLAPYLLAADTGVTSVTLNAADIDLKFGAYNGTNVPVFASAKLFNLSGKAAVPAANQWNAPTTFKGQLVVGTLATPPNVGPLDIIGSAGLAVSCARQLSATYTGALCQVTRASDSATLDVYPNGFGDLDRNSYAAFCRATTCAVSIMYDQSGNANNFTQSTTASQPALTLALAALGNRPALLFGDQSAFAMTATHASTIDDLWAAGGYAALVTNQTGNANAADRVLYKSNASTIGWDYRCGFVGTSRVLGPGASTTAGVFTSAALLAAAHIEDVQYSNTSTANVPTIGSDGTALTVTTTTAPVGTITTSDAAINLLLGNNAATAGTRGFPGYIAEVVLWKITPTSLQIEAIRRNQAAYYGVASVN